MKTRRTIKFSERFDKRWLSYVSAAGAAGVALIAAPQPSLADIIYTPANIRLGATVIALDGIHNALSISNFSIATTCTFCVGGVQFEGEGVLAFASNAGSALKVGPYGGPLPKGSQIGPLGSSPKHSVLDFFWLYRQSSLTTSRGAWARHKGYIGLKFAIGDQIHYGWIAAEGMGRYFDIFGWAYNTVPNAPIDAGQGQTPEPGTLGLLALGSLGLGFWRRRKAGDNVKDTAE